MVRCSLRGWLSEFLRKGGKAIPGFINLLNGNGNGVAGSAQVRQHNWHGWAWRHAGRNLEVNLEVPGITRCVTEVQNPGEPPADGHLGRNRAARDQAGGNTSPALRRRWRDYWPMRLAPSWRARCPPALAHRPKPRTAGARGPAQTAYKVPRWPTGWRLRGLSCLSSRRRSRLVHPGATWQFHRRCGPSSGFLCARTRRRLGRKVRPWRRQRPHWNRAIRTEPSPSGVAV
jgi:hypothetical protein